MPDLIDREALHQRINKMELWIPLDENSADSIVTCALHNARWILHLLDDMPTIEAEPRKHGKWERFSLDDGYDGTTRKCSICGYKWGDEEYHYCPNCGADMRGEK